MAQRTDILVAVDGSGESETAVGWAAAEAAARQVGVHVVHCVNSHGYGLWATTAVIRAGLRDLARPVVDKAVAHCQEIAPSVVVTGRVVLGSVAPVLTRLSSRFDLLVVGRRGHGAISSHVLGSVTQRLLTHAQCPVVAVGLRPDGMASGVLERVVVAVGDRATTGRAVSLGFLEAAERGVPFLAVHAWRTPALPPAGMSIEAAHPALLSSRAQQWVQSAVASARTRHPHVRATALAIEGDPRAVLRSVCRPGDLLVLGHHEHHALAPHPLGVVTAAVLHEAPCPVAVIGEPTAQSQDESSTSTDSLATLGA